MNRHTFTRTQTDRATAVAIGIMAALLTLAGIAGYVTGAIDRANASQTTQEGTR
jgi:hypothetical protein